MGLAKSSAAIASGHQRRRSITIAGVSYAAVPDTYFVRRAAQRAMAGVRRPGRGVRAKAGLNRVVLDAGFGLLDRLIAEKAEEAARVVVRVEAKFSSQTCSRCGHVSARSRRRRRFLVRALWAKRPRGRQCGAGDPPASAVGALEKAGCRCGAGWATRCCLRHSQRKCAGVFGALAWNRRSRSRSARAVSRCSAGLARDKLRRDSG